MSFNLQIQTPAAAAAAAAAAAVVGIVRQHTCGRMCGFDDLETVIPRESTLLLLRIALSIA